MSERLQWEQFLASKGIKWTEPKRPKYGKWEDALWMQLVAYEAAMDDDFPMPLRQFAFAVPERKFKADFCWPELRLIVEIEGQVHSIRAQRERDIERRQWCALNGWQVLSVSNKQVKSGVACEFVIKVVRQMMQAASAIQRARML